VGDRDRLIGIFNKAVRRPAQFGGIGVLALLLDEIEAAERGGAADLEGGLVWLPDGNARLSPAAILRHFLPDPDIHVAASQYGVDAHRRGWLRLDRTLSAQEHDRLVEQAATWANLDRTLHEVFDEYGQPSVVFGDSDPRSAKTLGYAAEDRAAGVVTFHFGPGAVGAVLLGVRVDESFFGG
jgi:hypothetical protein